MRYARAPQRRRAIAWFWHEGLASAADGPQPWHTHTHIHPRSGCEHLTGGGEQPNALSDPKLHVLCTTRRLPSLCAPHHLNTGKLPHSCEIVLFVWQVVWLASTLVKLVQPKKIITLSNLVHNKLSAVCIQRSLLLCIWKMLLFKTTLIPFKVYVMNLIHDIGIASVTWYCLNESK